MDRDEKLADVLVEFAYTLGTDFSVMSILDRLVQRVVEMLPVTGAGVMVMGEGDELHFVAASNETIEQLEVLQNALLEGPCVEAYRSGQAVTVPDLRVAHERFPRFGPPAVAAGLAAVFTFPMRLDEHRLGALDLYRDSPGELSAGDLRAAQVLADVAAAYLFNARARAQAAEHLVQARHSSLHDPLTGLPNRTLVGELLDRAVARAHRSHLSAAVLFIDLDRFKTVNDRFGHHIGDLLLRAVAARLAAALRPGDSLGRLAGDEFVILCEDLVEPTQGELVAQRITDALADPFHIEGRVVAVTASVGIAFSGPGEQIPGSLLRDADFAMYQAKADGGARHRVVDRTARLHAEHRASLEDDLRRAVQLGQFRLAYQPVVAAADRSLVGVEALLRWAHPERGPVPPDVIIPMAERIGSIVPLGQWVLRQACEDFMRWRGRYGPVLGCMAVNVSAHQLMSPSFPHFVAETLRATDMDASWLHLEVTESVLLEDAARAGAILTDLQHRGVRVSLDDFGTGFSSLSYLRLFRFDCVKIDRSFIAGLSVPDRTNRAIIESITGLARALDLSVIAEGVETEQQMARVSELGVQLIQGYLLGRPVLSEDLERDVLQTVGGPLRSRRSTTAQVSDG